MPFTITDPTGQVREAVAPDEAADAVIAIGWDDKGWPREKGSIGWAVVYGLQDGTLHVSRGLSYAEARRVVRFRWDQMTDEVIAGLRVGVRKVRGRWVLSERCPDGVVRTFTASDKPGTSSFRRPIAAQVRFSVLERDGFRCRYCGEGSADAKPAWCPSCDHGMFYQRVKVHSRIRRAVASVEGVLLRRPNGNLRKPQWSGPGYAVTGNRLPAMGASKLARRGYGWPRILRWYFPKGTAR